MPRRTLLTLPALGAAAVGLTVLVRGGVGPEEVPPMPEGVREPQRHDYGSDPSQFGELTLPAGVPRGVAVVVHGGFWKTAYGIEYARPLVPSLVEQGWATWAIEYRRVGKGEGGGGGNPETFDDVRIAIEELDELVLGVDPSTVPVVGIGHSAGGHLVAELVATDWQAYGLPADVIRSATAISGLFDLAPLIETSINVELGLDKESARRFSPLYRPPRTGAALTVAVGADETDEFLRQSRVYAERCRAQGHDCDLLCLEACNHYTVLSQLADAGAPLTRAMLSQMGLG